MSDDATFLAELRKDVRELTNVIITELKERYAEDVKILTRISELETKLAQFEKDVANLDSRLEDFITDEKVEEQREQKELQDKRKGNYAIIAALIAGAGSLIVDLFVYLNNIIK